MPEPDNPGICGLPLRALCAFIRAILKAMLELFESFTRNKSLLDSSLYPIDSRRCHDGFMDDIISIMRLKFLYNAAATFPIVFI